MVNYHTLTQAEAVKFARGIKDVFPEDAQLDSRELGDGNLNHVFHIFDQASGQSIILKQSLPYLKMVGQSVPLTLDRVRIECEALRIHGDLCPDQTPKLYAYEPDFALIAMEDLSDYTVLRRGLIERERYPLFAEHIGSFLARTMFFTSDLAMDQQEKKLRVKSFMNPELCNITEDLILYAPFTKSRMNIFEPQIRDAVEQIWKEEELHLEVALLREKYLTNAQALLHGDLHTDNIFIKPDSIKIIDREFAFYGPIGFDIGTVIANLLLNFSGQEGWSTDAEKRAEYRRYLLDTINDLWTHFEFEFRELWNDYASARLVNTRGYQESYMARLLQDTIGFAGVIMLCRVYGFIHVLDIDDIKDAEARERAQRTALEIGVALIKRNRSAHSIKEVLDIALKAAI
ncbi:S-methyl-5-thioribose kinase [Oceanobacillus piezotolerans]|uniref:S-methyl-5-thioribose kinase n=1 Tax=Oceanobacillus piezotolerans TaxID=2448030 RepID=A0A498D984_9BACI|nr:S-methyl-5-thioribose kinase [Oceanobacillus piezotolerans]RLL40618.1 S-methyl-5-thioribose kinase [Oceanobacillus piezotolerans]